MGLSDIKDSLPHIEGVVTPLKKLTKYQSEKPYFVSGPLDAQHEAFRTNLEYETKAIRVRDIRQHEHILNLENDGFRVFKHITREDLMVGEQDGADNTAAYMIEMVDLVKHELDAEKVFCYDYRYRTDVPCEAGFDQSVGHSLTITDETTCIPHTDHTAEGGLRRIRRHLDAGELDKFPFDQYRYRILNAWRPIGHPVYTAPLALCDYRSISSCDLIAADRVSPDYHGEVNYLQHNDDQCWYFLSHQSPDEVMLFTTFDTAPRSAIIFCPHSAFRCAEAPGALRRRSIELRLIVISTL